jgi:hypothetical protein
MAIALSQVAKDFQTADHVFNYYATPREFPIGFSFGFRQTVTSSVEVSKEEAAIHHFFILRRLAIGRRT